MSTGKLKKKTETKKLIYIPALIALLVLSILLSASIGQVEIPLSDTFKILMDRLFHVKLAGYAEIPSAYFNVVWMIRFPRALIAAAVGIGLSLCGIVMQAAVENPLADPYILGISSGATLGATFALMVGVGTLPLIGQASVSVCAFAGALLAVRYGHKLDVFGFFQYHDLLCQQCTGIAEHYFLDHGQHGFCHMVKSAGYFGDCGVDCPVFPDPKQHLESDADGRRSRHHAGHQPYFLA